MRTCVVFMGTPVFALPSLERLITAAQFAVAAVVTQPDRPTGRGRAPTPPPVKAMAQEYDLAVLQPRRLREDQAALNALHDLAPDVIIVAAYGAILPADVLELPRHGCVNVHASLLPKYRGAAPVAAAILEGEQQTGVTIMLMDEQMDHGPILAQRTTPILESDTRGALMARLAELGADLLLEVLPSWLAGEVEARPQPHDQATYTHMLKKADGEIDWTQPADHIARMTRAYDPWPGAFTHFDGKLLKILRASPLGLGAGTIPDMSLRRAQDLEPGTVIETENGVAVVAGGRLADELGTHERGAVRLEEVQLAGKRAMDAETFLRGQRDFVGSKLGKSSSTVQGS
jgi:methionyl-tRNA formyltransferase